MVDEKEISNQQEPTAVEVVADNAGNHLLQSFAALAQNGTISMGMTLNVSGQIISGLLIGRDEWFDLLAQNAANVSDHAGAFTAAIRDNLREAFASTDDTDDEDGAQGQRFGFLHLRDAAVQSGDNMTPSAMMWRIRISDVSAWSLQTMSRGN